MGHSDHLLVEVGISADVAADDDLDSKVGKMKEEPKLGQMKERKPKLMAEVGVGEERGVVVVVFHPLVQPSDSRIQYPVFLHELWQQLTPLDHFVAYNLHKERERGEIKKG